MNLSTNQRNWITVLSMALLALNQLLIVGLLVTRFEFLVKILNYANKPVLGAISLMTAAAFGALAGIYWVYKGNIGKLGK